MEGCAPAPHPFPVSQGLAPLSKPMGNSFLSSLLLSQALKGGVPQSILSLFGATRLTTCWAVDGGQGGAQAAWAVSGTSQAAYGTMLPVSSGGQQAWPLSSMSLRPQRTRGKCSGAVGLWAGMNHPQGEAVRTKACGRGRQLG